jgi:hypothetical protein
VIAAAFTTGEAMAVTFAVAGIYLAIVLLIAHSGDR